MEKLIFKDKYKWLILGCLLFLGIMVIKDLSKLNTLYVLHDEFGYWSVAAHMAGHDWSGIAHQINYYSYGYSLFLMPLFWIGCNPVIMYKLAIIINAIFWLLSFVLAIKCAEKLFPDINKYIRLLTVFAITLYSNNIVQTHITWSETLLYLMVWVIIWCVIKIIEKPTTLWCALLTLASVYIYQVHQRSLGVLITTILLLVLLKLCKKISWKQFCSVCILFVLLLSIHSLIKSNIMNNLWAKGTLSGGNEYSGQISKFEFIFKDIEGFISLIYSIGGKLFYLLTATFGLLFYGIYFAVSQIWYDVKKSGKAVIENKNFWIYSFLIISFLGTLAISSIYTVQTNKVWYLLYGRYNEFCIGPLLLIGVLGIYSYGIKKRVLLILGGISFGLGFVVVRAMSSYNTFDYNPLCSVGVTPLLQLGNHPLLIVAIGVISILIIFILISKLLSLSHKKVLGTIAGISLLIGLWLLCSNFILPKIITDTSLKDTFDDILDVDDQANIYYIVGNEKDYDYVPIMFRAQFAEANVQLTPITPDEIGNLNPNRSTVILDNILSPTAFTLIDKCTALTRGGGVLFMTPTGNVFENKYKDLGYEVESENGWFKNIKNVYIKDSVIENEEYFETSGEEGVMIYGPYLTLSPGEYEVKIPVQVLDTDIEELGYVEVYGKEKQYAKYDLNNKDFEDGNIREIVLKFHSNIQMEEVEFRVSENNGVRMRVYPSAFRKVK